MPLLKKVLKKSFCPIVYLDIVVFGIICVFMILHIKVSLLGVTTQAETYDVIRVMTVWA